MSEHINKLADLAEYLGINQSEIRQGYDENHFETADGAEYLVLADEEADKATREEIESSLWAFNPDFILKECNLIKELNGPQLHDVNESLRHMQEKCCEDCNEFFKAIIKGTCGLDKFVEDAINADGRGHFLSYYDGEENEQGDSFIYRVN